MNLQEAVSILNNIEGDLILMNVSGSYAIFKLPEEIQGMYNAFERDQIVKDLIKELIED